MTSKIAKIDESFEKACRDLQRFRFGSGMDKKPASIRRITKAIARHTPTWDILRKADFVEDNHRINKKGQTFNIFVIIIVMFMAVVFFGGLIYVTGLLNTTMHNVGLSNEVNAGHPGYSNMTKASDDTFGQMNSSIQALRLVALTLMFSLIIGFIFVNGMVKIHPAFFFVYILIVFLAVILAAPIANSYEALLKSDIYDGLLLSFPGSNWILLNLPLVTATMGILGGIFMFLNIIRIGNEVPL